MPVEASMIGWDTHAMKVSILLQSRVRYCWQISPTLHSLQSRINTLNANNTRVLDFSKAVLCQLSSGNGNGLLSLMLLPSANEVAEEVMFSQTCVKNSAKGGCTPPPRQTPPRADTAPPPDWVLQRTVRILLECIVVHNVISVAHNCLKKVINNNFPT